MVSENQNGLSYPDYPFMKFHISNIPISITITYHSEEWKNKKAAACFKSVYEREVFQKWGVKIPHIINLS